MPETIPHLVFPADVTASLAAASVVQAASFLSANGHSVAGRFSMLGLDGRITFFANDAHVRLMGLSLGQSVRVDCTLRGEKLVFFSQVSRIGVSGQWEIERPVSVHRRNLRTHSRVNTTEEEGVMLLVMSPQGMESCAVQNLSPGGCAIVGENPVLFGEGRVFQAWLAVPNAEPFGVYARCRWVSDVYGEGLVGMQFLDVPPVVEERLLNWIRKREESRFSAR